MEKSKLFTYAWHIDKKETEITAIRIYGLSQTNESVCLIVNDFTPYVYLELPTSIVWDEAKVNLLTRRLDSLLQEKKPIKKWLTFKYKLYTAHLDENYKRKKFPFLMLSFSNVDDIKALGYKLINSINVIGLGHVKLKMHEHNARPVLQLISQRKISTSGWTSFVGTRIKKENQITSTQYEYKVSWKNLFPDGSSQVAKPLILSYDIEVNSSNPMRFPKANEEGDKVFQISCILHRENANDENCTKYLLTLGDPDPKFLEGVHILKFDCESELLVGFAQFIQEFNPNIITGYNIFGFDIPYMMDRAKLKRVFDKFDQQSFVKYQHAEETVITWSSSAYGEQKFQFLDAEGRLFVDLLPLIKRDHKFSNYKLSTVATKFIGATKADLDPQGIFKCYRIGMKGGEKGRKAMGICGQYCMQDTVLVAKLFDKLQVWVGLTEMATVTRVPPFYLFTQGQQIKVFSQIYYKCTHENIVVEKDGYITKDDEHYVGAKVFPPIPGMYNQVIPFDFSSLYPTTIIAYNIDYSTIVYDEKVPDDLCHVMNWEDHQGCCITGDAFIQVVNKERPLWDLKDYRGYVLSYNLNTNSMVYSQQQRFYFQGIRNCVEIKLKNGMKLKCTPDHRILSSTGVWRRADLYIPNIDFVMVFDSVLTTSLITSIKPIGLERVYDIQVQYTHNFIANGFIVHNCHDPKIVRKRELTEFLEKERKELTQMRNERKKYKGKTLDDWNQKIKDRVEGNKPYTEEKTELNKSKPKHVMCKQRHYRFLKKPIGVLPSLLKDLLEARDHTKSEMKSVKKQMESLSLQDPKRSELNVLYGVLDKRQLAYKVSANSGYGAMGVSKGFLPFMPGAMSTTAMGRESIEKVAQMIPQLFGGKLIYGDTDSNYISFPHMEKSTPKEIWDYAINVANEISKLFPPPMSLAFEEAIYTKFIILTKKRYMSLKCKADGIVSKEIEKKGVLLARRDNCQVVRTIYSETISKIFDGISRDDLLYFLIESFNKLCSHYYECEKFTVSQSVGSTGDLIPVPFVNEKGKNKIHIGTYSVDPIPEDVKKREKKFTLKDATTEEEYYLHSLPAQAQLAEKMKRRGKPVESGSRLEYVITTQGGHDANKYVKIESSEYFKTYSNILEIDYLYYLKQLVKPIDQVLEAIYGRKYKSFVMFQYMYRSRVRFKVLHQLKTIFAPKLSFE